MMKDSNQLKIVIASDIDYEHLIAEIYCNEEFVALLQQEEGQENLKVEFSGNVKAIDLEWLQYALMEAREKLVNR